MHDVEFNLASEPGALAALGEAMGSAGIAFEGGGVFTAAGRVIGHFLFKDGEAAAHAARAAGIEVVAVRDVLVRRLKQGTPGQLGAIARALSNAGVNILTQYSDHHNQLILVVDNYERAVAATRDWAG